MAVDLLREETEGRGVGEATAVLGGPGEDLSQQEVGRRQAYRIKEQRGTLAMKLIESKGGFDRLLTLSMAASLCDM